jgi:8-hydroxy-5-deazaflavin:NADPH oxidoreductase
VTDPPSGRLTRRKFLALSTGVGIGAVLFPDALLCSPLDHGARTPLRIGIIGSGQMGGGLGLLWARAGHQILFSSRNPESLSDLVARAGPGARAGRPGEAAAFGDVVLVAVPYGSLPDVGRDHGATLRGKIVIDCGNPREDRDGPMANDAITRGTGVASADYLPGTRLVRAFNAISYVMLERDAHRDGERIGIPIAGDDGAAVEVTASLAQDAGFDPVVVGPLARARDFDRGTPVYVRGLTARQLREALGLPPG